MDYKTGDTNTLVFRIVGILFLTTGVILLVATLQFWIKRAATGLFGASEKGSYCTMEVVGSERLGDTYEGAQAEEGYTFYRLDFQVTNEGNETRYGDNYYGIYFNEDNGRYNDVLDWWSDSSDDEEQQEYLFEDYDYSYLPAGRTGRYQKVVQILDGVKSFTVDYYPGDSSGERISFEMTIE